MEKTALRPCPKGCQECEAVRISIKKGIIYHAQTALEMRGRHLGKPNAVVVPDHTEQPVPAPAPEQDPDFRTVDGRTEWNSPVHGWVEVEMTA